MWNIFKLLFSDRSEVLPLWFAHTLSVLSRLINTLQCFESLCWSIFISPVPRSFHSAGVSVRSNRYNFARLKCKRKNYKLKKGPIIRFLPPANEICEGYVFTGVCHSVHRGGGGGGVRGFFDEIRSMSGRYASYWNAFLFTVVLQGISWYQLNCTVQHIFKTRNAIHALVLHNLHLLRN